MPISTRAMRTVRARSILMLAASLAAILPARAEPSLADIAAQIKALRDENRQIREANRRIEGENARMRAAISELRAGPPRSAAHGAAAGRRPSREEAAGTSAAPAAMPTLAMPTLAMHPIPGAPQTIIGEPTLVTADRKFQYGAITITPGGFLAAESAFRSRTEQVDIGSGYQNIPFGPQAGTNEFKFSARQTRIAVLAEAPVTPSFLAAAYAELDFLGSGATSNLNESDSFALRIRHLYASLDALDYGFHLLAGQNWSLATLNAKGITPRNEVIPPTIDSQYVPGFIWKRQPQVRIVKDFNKRLWLALSAEQPQNVFTTCTPGVNGTTVLNTIGQGNTVTCDIGGNNNLNPTAVSNFSLNHVPDVVGKIAYEAKVGDRDVHLEAFGLYRDIYDRVAYPVGGVTASNQNVAGYGVGGGLVAPVLPKRLDVQLSGLYGRGFGSYGTSQFSDATFAPNGAPSALREQALLAGLTLHATPSVDVYAFAGIEQVQPDYYATSVATTPFAGYGAPNANNSGCFNTATGTAANCAGNPKRVFQVTGGFWDKLYKGQFGEVRVGAQYSYTQRELFQGSGGAPAALALAPKQNESAVLTSLRYYPFQ